MIVSLINDFGSGDLTEKCNTILSFGAQQLKNLVQNHPDYFPLYTVNGKWKHTGKSWTNWCEGFLGGGLWLVYEHTQDPWYRQKVEHYSRLIEHRKMDRNVHDLGFLFWSSWKRWYDLTGDPKINDVVIQAGQTLALRFKENGQYLRSFVADESLFIDIMMNVGIIYYAAQQTNDENLWRIANQHCLTTRRVLVRGDGSSAHEGIFDLETGEFLRQSTHQGWRGDSSWARGQAWALYGFTTAYEFSKDTRFLKTAQACADFFIARTPEHGVPPNDWEEPNPSYPYESSAAAITASGLLNLANQTSDLSRSKKYIDYAKTIINTLSTPEFLANESPGWEGILKHGMYHQTNGLGVDESVMWGEHFFLEAASKMIKLLN